MITIIITAFVCIFIGAGVCAVAVGYRRKQLSVVWPQP